jgi:hypothetical protein
MDRAQQVHEIAPFCKVPLDFGHKMVHGRVGFEF